MLAQAARHAALEKRGLTFAEVFALMIELRRDEHYGRRRSKRPILKWFFCRNRLRIDKLRPEKIGTPR